jgi:hypothetical protein
MKVFTAAIVQKLIANGIATRDAQQAGKPEPDHKPVLKIFNPTGAATWLLTEIVPDSGGDTLFGLCDLGMGEPELGYVSRVELESIRVRFGLRLERDLHFKASQTIGAYAAAARGAGRLVA